MWLAMTSSARHGNAVTSSTLFADLPSNETIDVFYIKTTEALKGVTLQQFQNCFEQWKERWDKCIDCQGEYFVGDYILEMFREIYDLKKSLVIFAPRPVFPFHTCIRQWEAELCL